MSEKKTLLYYSILNYQPRNIALLNDLFEVIECADPSKNTPELLARAQVILAPLGYYLGSDIIDAAAQLEVIAANTTGHPHIDVVYAREKGITVVTLKDQRQFLETITPTAELAFGLLIALTRNIIPARETVLGGVWNRRPFGAEKMLSRMSLGIAGLGRLGSMVASYAKSFGMTVFYCDPAVSCADKSIRRVASLRELVSSCEAVTIHIPHEPQTENLFNRDIFASFKRGSYLINTSRGELIDHAALLEALNSGRLAGAALDVFEGEFQQDFGARLSMHPLLEYARTHANLIITPHIGGSTRDAWALTEEYTIKQIAKALQARSTATRT